MAAYLKQRFQLQPVTDDGGAATACELQLPELGLPPHLAAAGKRGSGIFDAAGDAGPPGSAGGLGSDSLELALRQQQNESRQALQQLEQHHHQQAALQAARLAALQAGSWPGGGSGGGGGMYTLPPALAPLQPGHSVNEASPAEASAADSVQQPSVSMAGPLSGGAVAQQGTPGGSAASQPPAGAPGAATGISMYQERF
jgi:hypothetical protein